MDETFRVIIDSVRMLLNRYRSMEHEIGERYSFSSAECAVLAFLHNNPGHDTQSDITFGRNLAKSNVSAAVALLEEKGMIKRSADAIDRRIIHLSLTEKAEPFLFELEDGLSRLCAFSFVGFSENDRKELGVLMQRLLMNIRGEYGKR